MILQKAKDKLKLISNSPYKLYTEIYKGNKDYFKKNNISMSVMKHVMYWYNSIVMDLAIDHGYRVPYYMLGYISCQRMHRRNMKVCTKTQYYSKDGFVNKEITNYLYFIKMQTLLNTGHCDKDYHLKLKANDSRRRQFHKIILDIEDGTRSNIYAEKGNNIPKLHLK